VCCLLKFSVAVYNFVSEETIKHAVLRACDIASGDNFLSAPRSWQTIYSAVLIAAL